MTFKDLKKLVELPSYKEQRVPTVKALEVSGVPVVTEKVLENHGSINVYQNGYVIYRAHKRVTVFSLRDCVHYKYDAAEGAGHHIEEAEFDDYEWHIRLVLEGEDRIFMNYEIIQGKWMPSREDREYSKTVRFYDINYQLAQNEDKNTIFESWCDFLNYFDNSGRSAYRTYHQLDESLFYKLHGEIACLELYL